MHIVHTREPGSSNSYLAKFSLKKLGMIHIDQIIIYQRQPVAYSLGTLENLLFIFKAIGYGHGKSRVTSNTSKRRHQKRNKDQKDTRTSYGTSGQKTPP